MKRQAFVIVWLNPHTGLDEFWAGDEDAEPMWQFNGLATAYTFSDNDLAETAREQLQGVVPGGVFESLRVAPVTVTYRGKGKP
jgi:hypothetical protein